MNYLNLLVVIWQMKIIKHNQLLAEHTLKNEVQQLLSEYKHRNDIHEHRKQQNEWTT